MRDIPVPARNPQRQDSEVPAIRVEYDNQSTEQYSLSGSAIEECPAQLELDQSPTLNIDSDHLDVPPSSAASTYSRRSSSRPGSRASGKSSATMYAWDLEPQFPEESLRYKHRTKMLVTVGWMAFALRLISF